MTCGHISVQQMLTFDEVKSEVRSEVKFLREVPLTCEMKMHDMTGEKEMKSIKDCLTKGKTSMFSMNYSR